MFTLKKKINKIETKSLADEIVNAKTAADMWSVMQKLPNPDVILKAIGKDVSVLRMVASNYQVSSNIESRKAGVTSEKWHLNKGDCNDSKYKFFEKIFKNFDIEELISQILDAPLFGYVPIEIYWENNGKNIIPVKTVSKPQEWFHFDTMGNFYFRSKENRNGVLITEDDCKFLIPRRNATYLNPYGVPLLAKCYWYTLFMKHGFEFWFKFVEKYGMPFLYGKYDKSLSEDGKKNLFQGLIDMIQDAVGIIPNDGSIELLENSGKASDNYDLFIKRCENNCSKIILGQTLTTDIGSTGSYAASKTHQEVRQDIVDADKRLVEKTIKKLILMINRINFSDDTVPEFEFFEEEDTNQTVERDTKVQGLGVKFSKDYICKTYGYSEKDIEIIESDDEDNNFSEKTGNEINIPETNQTDIIDDLDDYLAANILKNPLSSELQKIVDFYSSSLDAEETEDKLAELYPKLSTEELENILTKIIFISSVIKKSD